jgi:type IV secretion system protein VirB9
MLLALISFQVYAVDVPKASSKDSRIKYVNYDVDNVIRIETARGASTLVILGVNERIVVPSVGSSSSCKDNKSEWCISANVGDNFFIVKPYEAATFNNLELITDRRVYSFDFVVTPINPSSPSDIPTARVQIRYPDDVKRLAEEINSKQQNLTTQLQRYAEIHQPESENDVVKRNMNYSMQIGDKSDSIVPSEAFDDGRFTYFKFPRNRDVPSIFIIGDDGFESRTSAMRKQNTDYMVIQAVAKRFILRSQGSLMVGIWNDSYDQQGLDTKSGTTIPNYERVLK